MKAKLEKNSGKTGAGRYRYFRMTVSIGIGGPKTIFEVDIPTLLVILVASRFSPQLALEKILFSLKITDQARLIRLKEFVGQLERDSINGAPFWNIFLQTTSLTTPRRIARVVSKELFQTKNTIDSRIKVKPLTTFQVPPKKNRFVLENSDWYPGYFDNNTVQMASLLEKKEVLESIKSNPTRYQILIKTVCKRENEYQENG